MKRRKALTGLSGPLLKNPHNVFGNGDRQVRQRVKAPQPRYCLSACAFSAVNSASLRKVITATLRVR